MTKLMAQNILCILTLRGYHGELRKYNSSPSRYHVDYKWSDGGCEITLTVSANTTIKELKFLDI